MAYVPNPADITQPTDAILAETAQAEFRALKAYIASLAGLPNSMNLFRKNKVLNGRMLFDQRNEGAAVNINSATAVYSSDRFAGVGTAAAGVLSLQKLATGISGASSINFLRAKVTTIDAAPAAGSFYVHRHIIEGSYLQELYWGTAVAKTTALSFIAQSTVAGTYGVAVSNGTRSYTSSFVIAAANTPQVFSIIIPGDIAGVWNTTTAALGIQISWSLASGATFISAAPNVWAAGNLFAPPGCTNLMATLNATLDITDVQFEVGGASSPIEIEDFEDTLLQLQRYYWKTFNIGTAPAQNVGTNSGEMIAIPNQAGATASYFIRRHPVQMRANASATLFNPSAANAQARDEVAVADCSATAFVRISQGEMMIQTTGNAGSTLNSFMGLHATFNADF